MDHLFIINPAAGKKDSTETLERLLERLPFPRKIVHTAREGDARRMTEAAAALGKPIRIYACGGDGTLNEVVNGAAGHDFLAVTNVPMGTGNDFLKLFGPNYRSIFSNLEALAAGPQAAFDLMDCNGKLGLDVICAGVDARIAAGVHKYKRLKGVSGRWAYLLSLAEQVLVRGICRPMTVSMGADRWTQEPTAILCICNGRHYGGGFMPVADAMPDDGVLDVLRVTEGSLAPASCLEDDTFDCNMAVPCMELGVWRGLYKVINEYLGGITLQSIIDEHSAVAADSYSI